MERPLDFLESVEFRVGYTAGLAVYRLRSGGVALVGGENANGQVPSEDERKAVCMGDDTARALASMLNEASEPKDRS